MNTTITQDQMILHDGEVYAFDKQSLVNLKSVPPLSKAVKISKWRIGSIEKWYIQIGDVAYQITHSTAKLDGVIHLNREWFVRGEDVEELAEIHAPFFKNDHRHNSYIGGFKAGYNAKKGEFSREEVEKAMRLAFVSGTTDGTMSRTQIINSLQPLTLPNSLTLNKDNELVKIEWA